MQDERLESLAGMVAQSGPRLDNIEKSIGRIENTLIDLSKAMVSIARVEERLANSADYVSQLNAKVSHLEGQIQSLMEANAKQDKEALTANAERDARAAGYKEKVAWMERVGWIVFSAAVGYVIYKAKMLG